MLAAIRNALSSATGERFQAFCIQKKTGLQVWDTEALEIESPARRWERSPKVYRFEKV